MRVTAIRVRAIRVTAIRVRAIRVTAMSRLRIRVKARAHPPYHLTPLDIHMYTRQGRQECGSSGMLRRVRVRIRNGIVLVCGGAAQNDIPINSR